MKTRRGYHAQRRANLRAKQLAMPELTQDMPEVRAWSRLPVPATVLRMARESAKEGGLRMRGYIHPARFIVAITNSTNEDVLIFHSGPTANPEDYK